jgi:hypothetical protein
MIHKYLQQHHTSFLLLPYLLIDPLFLLIYPIVKLLVIFILPCFRICIQCLVILILLLFFRGCFLAILVGFIGILIAGFSRFLIFRLFFWNSRILLKILFYYLFDCFTNHIFLIILVIFMIFSNFEFRLILNFFLFNLVPIILYYYLFHLFSFLLDLFYF